jgi:multiple antibiotic resistance protein
MLGPLKVIGPFGTMTAGHDTQFKRRLALDAIVIASIGTIAAVTLGVRILEKWGVSVGALLLTAGIILFLVALKVVLHQYDPHDQAAKDIPPPATAAAPPPGLAFSPLAFPTIITPYGVALLIVLVTLRTGQPALVAQVFGIAAVVLGLDYLAMLGAERILSTPKVRPVLGIVGTVLSVLQVALGVQAMLDALHLLGVPGLVSR